MNSVRNEKRLNKFSARDICLIGVSVAATAALSQVSIPLPNGVPITLQTFAVALSGAVLGAKKGFLSALIYILLGAVGVPVYAGFSGGFGALFGPAGGFILSFPALALLAGIGAAGNSKARLWIWLAAGGIANYLCGAVYFILVSGAGLKTALLACVLPFMPLDIPKFIAAGLLGKKIRRRLNNDKIREAGYCNGA